MALTLEKSMYDVLVRELQDKAIKDIQSRDLDVDIDGDIINMGGGELDPVEQAIVKAAVEYVVSQLIKIKA